MHWKAALLVCWAVELEPQKPAAAAGSCLPQRGQKLQRRPERAGRERELVVVAQKPRQPARHANVGLAPLVEKGFLT
ncbi:MAG TPA: hypothetical protein VF955_05925 [Pyrinomonadaceae bacterium]